MEPIINLDDPIGKTVGRRRVPEPLRVAEEETRSNEQWRDAGFGLRVRRGVYRFHSHEEADQWLMDHMTRKRES
ncbi:MAG: hypothetical protein ACREKL_00950 [Chthoniobacterales bacterium]